MPEHRSTLLAEKNYSGHRAFPPELKVPNAETRAAMAEAEEILSADKTRFATADDMFADLDRRDR